MKFDTGGEMLIIDISDPTAPKKRGKIRVKAGQPQPRGIGVSGNYAYIAFQDTLDTGLLEVVDIRDPDAPMKLGSAEIPGFPQFGVKIADNLIFVPTFPGLAIDEIQ